ncbi:MAG: DUF4389 domain-containing protein [Paracoccaceae bacterium]|nr:DUF4389 domain-containing protein [Paracoccaceae bacterium]
MAKNPSNPRKNSKPEEVAEAEVILEEPGAGSKAKDGDGIRNKTVWMRGLNMLILAIMMSFAGTLLGIAALLQFGWLLFAGHRNEHLSSFGAELGNWLRKAAHFQTVVTEEKPFPWTPWGRG